MNIPQVPPLLSHKAAPAEVDEAHKPLWPLDGHDILVRPPHACTHACTHVCTHVDAHVYTKAAVATQWPRHLGATLFCCCRFFLLQTSIDRRL